MFLPSSLFFPFLFLLFHFLFFCGCLVRLPFSTWFHSFIVNFHLVCYRCFRNSLRRESGAKWIDIACECHVYKLAKHGSRSSLMDLPMVRFPIVCFEECGFTSSINDLFRSWGVWFRRTSASWPRCSAALAFVCKALRLQVFSKTLSGFWMCHGLAHSEPGVVWSPAAERTPQVRHVQFCIVVSRH